MDDNNIITIINFIFLITSITFKKLLSLMADQKNIVFLTLVVKNTSISFSINIVFFD